MDNQWIFPKDGLSTGAAVITLAGALGAGMNERLAVLFFLICAVGALLLVVRLTWLFVEPKRRTQRFRALHKEIVKCRDLANRRDDSQDDSRKFQEAYIEIRIRLLDLGVTLPHVSKYMKTPPRGRLTTLAGLAADGNLAWAQKQNWDLPKESADASGTAEGTPDS